MTKSFVLNIIKAYDKENPIHSGKLESRTGLKGIQIRDFVRELRREGEPICHSSKGYYYTEDKAEVQKTIDNLEGRAASMYATASALRSKVINNFESNGQGKLF